MSTSRPTWTAQDRMPGLSWGLVLGAAFLGGLIAVLGYEWNPTYGAGIAFVLVVIPLLLATAQRAPQLFLMLLVTLTAINCFGFLTESAIFFRLMSAAAIVAMALRFASFEARELRPFVLLSILMLIGTVIAVLTNPSLESAVLAVMWFVPFFGLFTGAGLLKKYPEKLMETWYLLAASSGIAIALVNFYQWAAAGFVLQSYVITGPFSNANVTGAMLGFMVPIYLAMTQDRRANYRLAGWGCFLLAVIALMILVSRTALGLALAAPILFFLRGRPLLVLGLFCTMVWFGYIQTGMVPIENLNLPAAIEKPLATYRMSPREGETPRVISYGIAYLSILNNPIDGYGFGSGRTIMMASGHESYGPENLWVRNWLEGGLWLMIPTACFYIWAFVMLYLRGIFTSGRLHPFTYALILCCLMSLMYFLFNGGQTHMALRNCEAMALGTLALLLASPTRAASPEESATET